MGDMADSIDWFADKSEPKSKRPRFRSRGAAIAHYKKQKALQPSSGSKDPIILEKPEMKAIQSSMANALSSMFAMVQNVSIDMMTGQIGIKDDAGLMTLDADGCLTQNPMDFFSVELPAFAVLTPIQDVRRGDLLVTKDKAYGFVLTDGNTPSKRGRPAKASTKVVEEAEDGAEATVRQIDVLTIHGHVSRYRPRTISMMGVKDGILVVKPLPIFGAEQTAQAGNPMGNMASLLPLMMLMGDDKSGNKGGLEKLLPLMMLGGMGGGQGGLGAMNPLMLMALMGDKSPFK